MGILLFEGIRIGGSAVFQFVLCLVDVSDGLVMSLMSREGVGDVVFRRIVLGLLAVNCSLVAGFGFWSRTGSDVVTPPPDVAEPSFVA